MRLAWICVLAACGSKSAPPPAPIASPPETDAAVAMTPDAAEPVAEPVAEPEPPPPPPPAGPVVAIEGDIDGAPGNEAITLERDGTLTAGTAKIVVKFDREEQPEGMQLEVVPLGGKRRGVMVIGETEGSEDPPSRYQIFLHDKGQLRSVYNEVVDGEPVKFSAQGVGSYLESGLSACLIDKSIN
jgi:hypothetical protein